MSDDTKDIGMLMILEILGRPPEHLKETLNEIIKRINEEKGVKVKESKIQEPTLVKDQKDFYTTFAEIEVEVEDIMLLAALVFKYMPAHIEVLSPETLKLSNNSWNEIFNEITRRLHGYDEIARILQNEKMILENKLRELMEEKKDK